MAITLRRQISDSDKDVILHRHGRKDWVTGRDIPENEAVHFDHIEPYARGGVSELNNIAPMSQETNLRKGRLTLAEYKTKLRIQRFFDEGDRQTLGHLLRHLSKTGDVGAFGAALHIEEGSERITLQTDDLKRSDFAIQKCPITGWRYFYATLPVELLDSDDDSTDPNLSLQPRYLIFDKVFGLYRHFLIHPVLQPCIGRIVGQRIRVFDGQHKVAGLIFASRREFECKIYIDADARLLNQTNISAHDAFAQTRFFSSIMVMKLGAQFGRDFEDYKADERVALKSESGFMDWLKAREGEVATTGDLNKRFRAFLYNAVLQDSDNKMSPFISAGNRSSERTPITMDQLERSLLSDFLYRHPVDQDMASEHYKRESEFENMVFLMNEFHDLVLHRWNPQAGKGDHEQLSLNRIIGSKSMQAWSEILRDAVCAKLELHDASDREMPFHRELGQSQRELISWTLRRLVNWQGWQAASSSDIDRHLSDNVSELKRWFKEQGLSTGYLMGATE